MKSIEIWPRMAINFPHISRTAQLVRSFYGKSMWHEDCFTDVCKSHTFLIMLHVPVVDWYLSIRIRCQKSYMSFRFCFTFAFAYTRRYVIFWYVIPILFVFFCLERVVWFEIMFSSSIEHSGKHGVTQDETTNKITSLHHLSKYLRFIASTRVSDILNKYTLYAINS